MTVPLLAGMAAGLGLWLLIVALVVPVQPVPAWASRVDAQAAVVEVAVGVVVSVVVLAVTGWLVGGLVAGAGAVAARRGGGHRRRREGTVARTEAVAAWAEMLRDTMAAAAGIEQAIASTAAVAPEPIREPVRRLAAGLERGRLAPALVAFAEELGDPAADLVVTGLLLASRRQARELGPMLGALARSARHEAALMLRIDAGRSRTRTAARVVTATTLGFAGVLVLFNRPFLEPYDSASGQAWLLAVALLFSGAFWKLRRLARLDEAPRLFSAHRIEAAP